LAELAKSPVPDIVNMAYGEKNILFGPDYIIPKPLDPRLLSTVAPAVAQAAIESGVAKHRIEDWDVYKNELDKRLGIDNQVLSVIGSKARRNPKRIVYAEADNLKILKAAQIVYDAVWADTSDTTKTYQNAAHALLVEIRKRAGVGLMLGPLQPLTH